MDKDNDQNGLSFEALSGGPYPLDDAGQAQDSQQSSLSSPISIGDSALSADKSVPVVTLGVNDASTATDSPAATSTPYIADMARATDGPGIPPNYIGAVTSIVNANVLDVVVNLIGQPGGLLPAPLTRVNGIYVYVNGVRRDILRFRDLAESMRRDGYYDGNSSDALQKKTIRVYLSEPIKYGDEVQVSYFDTSVSLNRITDTASNNLSPFYLLESTNQTGGPLFDLLSWVKSPVNGYDIDPNIIYSDIHELREGWPMARTILDTLPPMGQAIINDNPTSSGISVHWFVPYQDEAGTIPVLGTALIKDNLDRTIRRANAMGGVASPNTYETIGDSTSRSIMRRFAPVSGVYPSIKRIDLCLTSDIPRQYTLEVKRGPNDLWAPVLTMIANTQSINFFRFKFNASGGEALAGARLRAKGDFFSTVPLGNLTVSAIDDLSGTVSMRASHFSDMKDALDFSTNTDQNGWMPFDDGTSVFDWNLLNTDRIWTPFRYHNTSTGVGGLAVFNNQLYSYYLRTLFIVQGRNSTQTELITVPLVSGNISCFTVHKGVAFFGTTHGRLYKSQDGINWNLVAVTPNGEFEPISSLASYQNFLYVGTTFTTSTGDGNVYTWDGTTLTLKRSFSGLYANCMTVAYNKLFVGLGGPSGSFAAQIQYFDGATWTATVSIEADLVEALQFANGVVWAGVESGVLYVASFDQNGNITSWDTPPQAIDCNHFTQIREDTSFVWFTTDTGLYAYHKGTQSFLQIDAPPIYASGLTAQYTASNLANVKNVGLVIGQQASEVVSSLNIPDVPARYNALFSPDVTNYVNASFTGYIRVPFTGTYTFYLTTSDGGRLYLSGGLSGITWTNGSLIVGDWDTPVAGEISGTANLIAGQLTPIRIEWYQTTMSSGSMRLQWQSNSIPKEDIPLYALFQHKTITGRDAIQDIAVAFGATVGGATSGEIYELDATDLVTRKRRVYVQFRDGAGNISDQDIEVATDTIFQDADRSGVDTGLGRIYQVANDKTIVASFQSDIRSTIFAPNREIRDYGVYESIPYYVASLTRWDTISFLGTIAPGVDAGDGLDKGTSIEIYVRSADSKESLLAQEYSTPFVKTSIPPGVDVGVVNPSYNIGDFAGKWLQFKIRLVTATVNVTPVINSVTLAYKAAASSFFFSSVLDTSLESPDSPAPQWRRGLLTANMIPNGGFVQYGYTTNMDPASTFDYSLYTPITPNTVFTLPSPSSRVRFGIMLVSISDSNPAIVDNYAVQLEAAKSDMKLMD